MLPARVAGVRLRDLAEGQQAANGQAHGPSQHHHPAGEPQAGDPPLPRRGHGPVHREG